MALVFLAALCAAQAGPMSPNGTEPSVARSEGFVGSWMTSFGPMHLGGEGSSLKGTYGFAGESTIEGEVAGDRFVFTWRGPRAGGAGWFALWEDGDVFQGEYAVEGRQGAAAWVAYRKRHVLPEPRPGEIVQGQGECGMAYHLRAPTSWTRNEPTSALMFFHGSNMTSRAYVDTIVSAFPELAEDYLLIGVEGELLAAESTPGQRVYNYSYVNFSGHEVGEPWRWNQSPGLVARLLREIDAALLVERWFLGGHSQGGFLTYAMAMFYPDLVDGALPVSCDLLVQCEPDAFEDEGHKARQRQVAIAHVHGENDPLVQFSSALHCSEAMQDGGIEAARLFGHPSAGHMFALLPIEQALRWLEGVTSTDVSVLSNFAERALEEGDERGAIAALRRAGALVQGDRTQREVLAELWEQIERTAAPEAARIEALLRANADVAWVDDFWDFRRRFAYAPSAGECLQLYAQLREQHAGKADELFHAARNERDVGRRRELHRRIVDEYYASKWYKLVRRWLE